MSEEMLESKVKYETYDDGEIPVTVIEKRKRENKSMQFEDLRTGMRELAGQERFWAALAHAMGPAIIVVAMLTDGFTWVGLILITAGIYVYYRDKSPLIMEHARQALAAQLIGTFGWIALLVSGIAIWVVLLLISLVLILALVGLILTPLVALSLPVFVLGSFALPLAMGLFGAIGAWETWHGRDFRYPYVAEWVDRHFGSIKAKREIITV